MKLLFCGTQQINVASCSQLQYTKYTQLNVLHLNRRKRIQSQTMDLNSSTSICCRSKSQFTSVSKTHKRLKERILITRNLTKRARVVRFRLIKKRSFNLLCVVSDLLQYHESTRVINWAQTVTMHLATHF